SLLGLTGYFGRFVDKSTHCTMAVYKLTKIDDEGSWQWQAVHQRQFTHTQMALTTSAVLATIDPNADFILQTEAWDRVRRLQVQVKQRDNHW
ncbi:hypothetical protein FN846DRAFT_755151, partial [Sphaerosporella brunnea]